MNPNVVTLKAGSSLGAIYPQSIEDVYRLATMAFKAGMIKPQKIGYGDNAVTEDAEAVLARGTMIIMQGMELGVPPMQAVQLLAMINGRITAHSEAVPGILLAHGCKLKETWTGTEMADDWTCHVELTRPGGDKFTGSFSVKDAKHAGLWDRSPMKTAYGKTKPNDAAWFRYPKRMLKARALGFVGKDGAADFLKGIQVREEIEDQIRVSQMHDVTPAKPEPLAIPDIPDVTAKQTDTNQDQAADVQAKEADAEPDNEPIADPDGLLAKLADDIALCDSETELSEVAEQYADLLPRLPASFQKRARKMLNEESA